MLMLVFVFVFVIMIMIMSLMGVFLNGIEHLAGKGSGGGRGDGVIMLGVLNQLRHEVFEVGIRGALSAAGEQLAVGGAAEKTLRIFEASGFLQEARCSGEVILRHTFGLLADLFGMVRVAVEHGGGGDEAFHVGIAAAWTWRRGRVKTARQMAEASMTAWAIVFVNGHGFILLCRGMESIARFG